MRLAILDTNYYDQRYSGMAATWLRWELAQIGVQEYPLSDADTILATTSSQQGVTHLRHARRQLPKGARLILGGGGAYAPAVFEQYVDAICVGEGRRFVRTLCADGYEGAVSLPETWRGGETRSVVPYGAFPWDMPPLRHPDGTVRVFGARGCRYRCLFCQTGWEAAYRAHPQPAVVQQQIAQLERMGCKMALVVNDAAQKEVRLSGKSEFLSVRADNLQRMLSTVRLATKGVRIGVEGVSERLRLAIGKPVKNDGLLSMTHRLLADKVGVRWFFIVGLPGETDADYEELRYLVTGLKRAQRGVVMLNFHAFIPQPATPLCVLPLTDTYWERFEEFRRWFFHGLGFTRRVQIVPPAQYAGRLARAQESMAAGEAELRRGWMEHDNANWRVQYLATPMKLRQIAQIYARHVRV